MMSSGLSSQTGNSAVGSQVRRSLITPVLLTLPTTAGAEQTLGSSGIAWPLHGGA
jgi:hypothetical protein